jgi:hypothetical protein
MKHASQMDSGVKVYITNIIKIDSCIQIYYGGCRNTDGELGSLTFLTNEKSTLK